MTHPHTAGRAESPRGVETNGEGNRTTAHLNLTRTMARQIRAEWDQQLVHSAMKGRYATRRPSPRFRIQGDPRVSA